MTTSKARPEWDLDYSFGKEGEQLLAEFLDWVITGNLKVEVKRKRYLDHKIYVETHCDKGRTGLFAPSGINVTTAQVWAFVIGQTGVHIALPTEVLREAINDPSATDKEENDGRYPTRGKLVDFTVLLYRLKQKGEREIAAERQAIQADSRELSARDIHW